MLVNSSVFDIEIGRETLLFDEENRSMVLLDDVAKIFWYGLSAGIAPAEIAKFVASESGADEATVRRDLDVLLGRWKSLGLVRLDGKSADYVARSSAGGASSPADARPEVYPLPPHTIDLLPRLGTFGIGNVVFHLRSSEPEVQLAADQLFDHVRIDGEKPVQFTLSVERQEDGWALFCNGAYQTRCGSDRGIAPMLHANALLWVYRYSNVEIALHAAAVADDKNCVILPAESGSGKSTLSAALVTQGFRFCSDDLVLLSGTDLAVIPVDFCIGLKEGAWEILAPLLPAVRNLATQIREDGKAVRYLPPPTKSRIANRQERLHARLLVFPTYDADHHNEHHDMTPGKALVRLTEAGYDIAPFMNRNVLLRLVSWVEGVRCVEMHFNSLDYAIDVIASLVHETGERDCSPSS